MRKASNCVVRVSALMVVACLAALSAAQNLNAPTKQSTSLPAWKAEAAMNRQLGVRTRLRDYSIQPPLNATFQDRDNLNTYAFFWKGQGDANLAPALYGNIITLSPYQRTTPKPEQLLDAGMDALKRRFVEFSHTPPEQGRIGSLIFARAHWNGTNAQHQVLEGFTYICVDGRKLITLNGQSTEPARQAQNSADANTGSSQTENASQPPSTSGDSGRQAHAVKPTPMQVAEASVLTIRKQ